MANVFFQKNGYNFSKNCQTNKKMKKIFLFKSIHQDLNFDICVEKYSHYFISGPKKYQFFSQILKSPPDSGDGDVDGDGENFLIENFVEN